MTKPYDPVSTYHARRKAAEALRQLGHALVGHQVDEALAERIAAFVHDLLPEIEAGGRRSRGDEIINHPPFADAIREGEFLSLFGDRDTLDMFFDSIVSGRANPLGIAVEITLEEEEAVARVNLDHAFEGAPGRAHGGIVSAIIDETMGALLPIIGTLAYTATLSITYLAPTPMHEELEFRARLTGRDERKLFIECRGSHEGEVFVEAEALFLAVDLDGFADHFADHFADRLAAPETGEPMP